MNFLQSLIKNKYFWITVAALIVATVIYLNIDKIKKLFWTDKGDYEGGSYNADSITQQRQAWLKQKATEANTLFTSTFVLPLEKQVFLRELLALNDNELKFLSKYYKDAITRGTSLYADIDDEVLFGIDEDETLMSRLSVLNEQ